jgi:succinoglycan biosynthesis protein ExoL
MKICYFLHDVGHPDLKRRFGMLQVGGAETTVIGFHRSRFADDDLTDKIIDLGQTADSRFAHRIWAVASAIPRLRRYSNEISSSKVILARNLEMLLIAAIARRLYAPRAALVYECLDIHRLMLSSHVVGKALRGLERHLLTLCQGLMVSSSAFVREYFSKTCERLPKVFIVENKLFLADDASKSNEPSLPAGPPWRIGWFGILRCRRSLDILCHVLRTIPEVVTVITAGKPVADVFPNFDKDVRAVPGLTFLGGYKDEQNDLARLYGSVHFAWTIDFYEADANSSWLLPNRLYRAIHYGAVPLAMANSETGNWLQAKETGILLQEPVRNAVVDAMRQMTPEKYVGAKLSQSRIPRSALIAEADECRALVNELGELGAAVRRRT